MFSNSAVQNTSEMSNLGIVIEKFLLGYNVIQKNWSNYMSLTYHSGLQCSDKHSRDTDINSLDQDLHFDT